MTLLTDAEASAYRNERHQRETDLRFRRPHGVRRGDQRTFYMRGCGLLMDLIGPQSSPVAPLYLLDADCGKGWFSRERGQHYAGAPAGPDAR